MKFLNIDSPLIQALNKVADLMYLNILAFLCCLPIVTVGPSLTALHYMSLKIVRNEECYIAKGFFKSFRDNLKQGICIWLMQLAIILVLGIDYYILFFSGESFHFVFQVLLLLVTVLVIMTSTFVYPMLAKFDNTIFMTIRNSLFMSLLQLPKTVIIFVVNCLPLAIAIFVPQVIPICFLFGLSAPAMVAALLYNKFFQRIEDNMAEANKPEGAEEEPEEDERIFKDEIDPALMDKEV